MPASRTVRRKQFEINLTIKEDKFINPPQVTQKNWLISRAMDELADDLIHLDALSTRFVAGSKRSEILQNWVSSQAQYDDSQLIIDGQQVMQDWERPYMEAMAKVVTLQHGDVLEVGFGMGISASYIQAMGVNSHTIIECNEEVRERCAQWKDKYQDVTFVSFSANRRMSWIT